MTRRRGFGSARKLPAGHWQAVYWHQEKRHSAGTFPTDADAALALVQARILRGEWVDPAGATVLLGEYARRWLEGRSDLRPTTRAKYQDLLDRKLLPSFAHLRLGGIAPDQVHAWYHGEGGDDGYRLLRAIFQTAVRDQLLARSPCTIRGAGSVKATERPVASVPEVLAAARAMPERLRLAVLLAAFAQLRRGEVLGLQRQDCDLLHGTIEVRRAVVQPSGGKPLVGPPKTAAGARSLALPAPILDELQGHLVRHVAPDPKAWLFPGRNGDLLRSRYLDRAWEKVRLTINRPDLRWHDLRHGGLTWAAATGATVAELMRRGGHASSAAALRYQHATWDRDKALADALGGLLQALTDLARARIAHDDPTTHPKYAL